MQVPEGPAHKHLEPGDVLVRINGEVIIALKSVAIFDIPLYRLVTQISKTVVTTVLYFCIPINLVLKTEDNICHMVDWW